MICCSPLFNRLSAVALLAGLATQNQLSAHRSAGVGRYQAAIHAAADTVPLRIDAWVGHDVPVPARALTVLKPNLLISRQYLDVETGTTAGLFVVHCNEAHSMVGHFPLRCYKAQGWELIRSQPRDWQIDSLKLTGTEYEFNRTSPEGQTQTLTVANCLLRPNGKIFRDMDGMTGDIVGAFGSSSGAGQLQVYFFQPTTQPERDAAVVSLTRGCLPVINAILASPAN
jgi:hypothetical protein